MCRRCLRICESVQLRTVSLCICSRSGGWKVIHPVSKTLLVIRAIWGSESGVVTKMWIDCWGLAGQTPFSAAVRKQLLHKVGRIFNYRLDSEVRNPGQTLAESHHTCTMSKFIQTCCDAGEWVGGSHASPTLVWCCLSRLTDNMQSSLEESNWVANKTTKLNRRFAATVGSDHLITLLMTSRPFCTNLSKAGLFWALSSAPAYPGFDPRRPQISPHTWVGMSSVHPKKASILDRGALHCCRREEEKNVKKANRSTANLCICSHTLDLAATQ